MSITLEQIPTTWTAKLGSFSKAVANSVSLNFSESGGVNCADSCKMKAGGCYAVHTEKMKPSIATSGERKRVQGVIATSMQYIAQLSRMRDNAITWARFSTFGSVPATLSDTQKAVFMQLLIEVDRVAEHTHFPVETEAKRELYQGLCDLSNVAICVRVSTQTITSYKRNALNRTASSVVVTRGKTKRDRLEIAEKLALDTNTIVCPAVKSTILKTNKVKCGECVACSISSIQVIYPKH